MCRSFLFPLCLLLVLVIKSSANKHIGDFKDCYKQSYPKDDIHYDYDNNFESGIIFPWIEQSESGVKWRVENKTSPWEPGNIAPTPVNGSTYLRVDRGSTLSFGVAVLRSQIFTLRTDEVATFSFDFWIRSKWPQFTNLELYLAKNGNEGLRLNLYEYSRIDNRVWESKETSLEGRDMYNSNLSLVFYAYCGTEIEDAVAVDNLKFQSFVPSTDPPTEATTTDDPTEAPITEPQTSTEPGTSEPQTTETTTPTTTTTTTPTTDPTTDPPTESPTNAPTDAPTETTPTNTTEATTTTTTTPTTTDPETTDPPTNAPTETTPTITTTTPITETTPTTTSETTTTTTTTPTTIDPETTDPPTDAPTNELANEILWKAKLDEVGTFEVNSDASNKFNSVASKTDASKLNPVA